MSKVIVAGTRTFSDYGMLRLVLDEILKPYDDITIISGGARGADALGERYASERGYNVIRFPAEWDKYGKAAGPIRNRKMAEVADICVVFWDGKSRGAKNMIEEAKNKGCTTYVSRFK